MMAASTPTFAPLSPLRSTFAPFTATIAEGYEVSSDNFFHAPAFNKIDGTKTFTSGKELEVAIEQSFEEYHPEDPKEVDFATHMSVCLDITGCRFSELAGLL